MTQPRRFHILTGDYPPKHGGVSDYASQIARTLARRGVEVHIWTTGQEGSRTEQDGVIVHREVATWSRPGLARLGEAIDRTPGPRELLVQYVPHNFGCRGINVWLGPWLGRRARGGDLVRTMFHEVAYHATWPDRPKLWVLHFITRKMARDILRASHRVDISIPGWQDRIRGIAPRLVRPTSWMPVPSNVPVVDDPAAESEIRARVGPPGTTILGTFGTYSPWIRARLGATLHRLLDGKPGRAALILGRGSEAFAAELIA
jgi:glycosyltransferase involved in cell wall biosynthesis